MNSNRANPNGELIAELHHHYATSEYGEMMAGRIRYADYKPEHVTNHEWERMFGADVNNLDHLPLTHSLTRGFIRACRNPHEAWEGPVPSAAEFSDDHARVLEITAITHDWAEGPLRDIMYHLKTDQDEAEEVVVLHALLAELAPQYYRLPEFQQAVEVMADRKATTHLGRAFNTVERMGYLRTGIRFWERRMVSDDPVLNEELDFIAHFVFHEHVPVLLERARLYPATDEFLRSNLDRLTRLVEDYDRRAPLLTPAYDKHMRPDDPRRTDFGRRFVETATQLRNRYGVDAVPAAA